MDISGFLSPLITKFLDLILPNENKEIKQKKELGKYLLRVYSIIDAYSNECRRLQREISEIKEEPLEHQIDSLAPRLHRLRRLTMEFGATIGEISYLRLFDSDMSSQLVAGALAELGMLWPETYESLIVDAETIAQLNITEAGIELYPSQFGQHIVIDIFNEQECTEFISALSEVIKTLAEAEKRLSAFVSKNFKVWELFDCRDELGRHKEHSA